jgi:hypothetical protein
MEGSSMKTSMIGLVLASCALFGLDTAAAQSGGMGAHGGLVREVGPLKVEVVFDREEVHVFVLDAEQKPVDLGDAEGAVQVTFQSEIAREPVSLELKASRGRGAKHLQGEVDLRQVLDGEATATVRLNKVPGREGELSVEVPFRLARLSEHA